MRPKVDFCFRELMTDDELRRDFIAALLELSPETIETQLLPAHLRKEHGDDKLGIHILELPKLAVCEQPESELLNWARFINAEKKEAFEMIAEKNPVLQKAYDKLVHISADEQKRLEYEDRLKAIRDYNTQMQSSWEEGWEDGHSQGWEDGEKYGEQKGMEMGEQKEKNAPAPR